LRIIVLALIVLAAGTIGTYVGDYVTTFAQSTLHMSASVSFLAGVALNLAAVVAVLIGGFWSDRVGRRPLMIWTNLTFLVLVLPINFWIVTQRSAPALLIGNLVLGFVGALGTGVFYTAVTETLPKRIRGGAFATIYATSIALFGGTTQLVITWLIKV